MKLLAATLTTLLTCVSTAQAQVYTPVVYVHTYDNTTGNTLGEIICRHLPSSDSYLCRSESAIGEVQDFTMSGVELTDGIHNIFCQPDRQLTHVVYTDSEVYCRSVDSM